MNDKDKGNQCFKARQYKQAIAHYKAYLQQEHEDNKNAWFNLSLCQSKINAPKDSIQSALEAVKIDPQYFKCYYRLALQYSKLKGHDYDIFINASLFQKFATPQQTEERKQMQDLANKYRKKLNQTFRTEKKVANLEQIINQTENLEPERQIRQEIDLEIHQWKQDWLKNPHQAEAQWLQIQYVTEDIDYDHGINLAYFYMNQLKDQKQKAEKALKITDLKKRLGKQKVVDLQYLGIDPGQFLPQKDKQQQTFFGDNDEEQENLFADDTPHSKYSKNDKPHQQAVMIQKKQAEKIQHQLQQSKPLSLQQKLQEKRKKLEEFDQEASKEPEKEKPAKKIQKSKQPDLLQTHQPIQKEKNCKNRQNTFSEVQKSSDSGLSQPNIDELYEKHCGFITISKDIFHATFAAVVKILELKEMEHSKKGEIFVLMKKRIKKFNKIMEACSQNQQTVIYDLLKRNGLEQYAVDLAPKFHSI